MILRDIAHCRAGDKGDTLNVSVIAYDERDYAFLAQEVTVERVRAAFGPLVKGRITRYDLPNLGALNFVLEGALAGGVTTSLAADPHGKTLSALLVAMVLPERPRRP
jgi:phage tail sheath gpL-like